MADEKKGNVLDSLRMTDIKKKNNENDQKESQEAKEPEKNRKVFNFSEDENTGAVSLSEAEDSSMPSIADLKKAQEEKKEDSTPAPDAPDIPVSNITVQDAAKATYGDNYRQGSLMEKAAANFKQKEDAHREEAAKTSSGVTIEDDDTPTPEAPPVPDGIVVEGKMGQKETQEAIESTMREMDLMTKLARERQNAAGQKVQAVNTHIDILIDKVGLRQVEFTDEERSKMKAASKIVVTQVEDATLKSIKVIKPKAIHQKKIIEKSFSSRFAPFVAPTSGYMGKVRALSSLEVIDMVAIDESDLNTSDAVKLKASLVYNHLMECSTDKFADFDDFCKKTTYIDLSPIMYGLVLATYPAEETITMNCANPECTHKARDPKTGRMTDQQNQFTHHYKNSEVLLTHRISEKLAKEAENVFNHRHTVDDAVAYRDEHAIMNTISRFRIGDNIIIEVYCPSITEYIDDYSSVVEKNQEMFKNLEGYGPAITMTTYLKKVYLANQDDNDGSFYEFDNTISIIEALHNMSTEELKLIQQCIQDEVGAYMYSYGFKAENVVCPHCAHAFTEDALIPIDRLLFHQGQRHTIND